MDKEKKSLILDIFEILNNLPLDDAKYLAGYVKGFEASKDMKSLSA